jgi:hypothetical protein
MVDAATLLRSRTRDVGVCAAPRGRRTFALDLDVQAPTSSAGSV